MRIPACLAFLPLVPLLLLLVVGRLFPVLLYQWAFRFILRSMTFRFMCRFVTCFPALHPQPFAASQCHFWLGCCGLVVLFAAVHPSCKLDEPSTNHAPVFFCLVLCSFSSLLLSLLFFSCCLVAKWNRVCREKKSRSAGCTRKSARAWPSRRCRQTTPRRS